MNSSHQGQIIFLHVDRFCLTTPFRQDSYLVSQRAFIIILWKSTTHLIERIKQCKHLFVIQNRNINKIEQSNENDIYVLKNSHAL